MWEYCLHTTAHVLDGGPLPTVWDAIRYQRGYVVGRVPFNPIKSVSRLLTPALADRELVALSEPPFFAVPSFGILEIARGIVILPVHIHEISTNAKPKTC